MNRKEKRSRTDMKAEVVGEISLNLLKEDGGWRGQEGHLREMLKAGKKTTTTLH